jgi:hypothetical protein
MLHVRRVILALGAFLALAAPACASAQWQRGVDFASYSAAAYGTSASDASLARLAADGNDSVSFVVTQYMATPTSSSVGPTAATPTDASLLHAMRTARSLGLNVNLKPQIDISSGGWVGGSAPADLSAWFASYEAMIDHYADLAQQGGASMLVIGTELKPMSGWWFTPRWDSLIAGIRQRFSGQLTYAADFSEFGQVQFWDRLDYIGVDAYFPLETTAGQPVSSLVSAWSSRGWVSALRSVALSYGKPLLFTEIGYRSITGAAIHPNFWWTSASYDMAEQQNAFEAAYETFAGQSWFGGVYWWGWLASLPPNGWNGDYTPVFKPAENVMRSWNARLAPIAAAVPGSPVAAPAPPAAKTKPKRAARGRRHKRRVSCRVLHRRHRSCKRARRRR